MDGDFIRKALLLLLANWKKDGLYYSPSYARPLLPLVQLAAPRDERRI